MISIIKYLDCGTIYKREKAIYIRVTNFYDIANKIIPFFRKNSILGVKAQDFNDFCLVAEMIKNKKHLLKEGLEQIKTIKAGINSLPPPPARGEGRGPAGPQRGPPAGGRKEY